MQSIYVITEYDRKYGDITVIGVADSIINARMLMSGYYGSEFEIVYTQDIRDSGVEYVYELQSAEDDTRYSVTILSFTLNSM